MYVILKHKKGLYTSVYTSVLVSKRRAFDTWIFVPVPVGWDMHFVRACACVCSAWMRGCNTKIGQSQTAFVFVLSTRKLKINNSADRCNMFTTCELAFSGLAPGPTESFFLDVQHTRWGTRKNNLFTATFSNEPCFPNRVLYGIRSVDGWLTCVEAALRLS